MSGASEKEVNKVVVRFAEIADLTIFRIRCDTAKLIVRLIVQYFIYN